MKINWSKDYNFEFVCPHCDTKGLSLAGKDNYTNRKLFRCPKCRKRISQCVNIKFPNTNTGINWNNDYKIGEFACPNPNCDSRDIRLASQSKEKQRFRCNVCGTSTRASIDITPGILSQYAHKRPVKSFSFQDNKWDIRAIKPPANKQEKVLIANFETIQLTWFKNPAKHYIYHLCKLNRPISNIEIHLCNLRIFSRYLAEKDIQNFNLIDRSLILDFLVWDDTGIEATNAKVVQEQQEYIEQLWGIEWNYLFCHYQRPSRNKQYHNIIPVKKVIPRSNSLFRGAIEYLIEIENIRDENGKLAKFSPCLIRHTRLTQLFEQGHDLSVVSAWAGHKYLATTSTFYTQVSCELIEKEAGHIQRALFNANGQYHQYESLPKSFWKDPQAHKLDLPGDHINTPIYGYCGLPLNQRCDKFRACYTCGNFVAVSQKLPQYIKTRDELRAKESRAKASGQDVLVEQFGRQADQLDKIIASLQEAA